ncbi:MAG TPA: RDD family protein [Planctomycetota bacterium]|nr:RDD family protein [Planctomycetota bacterium]
MIYQRFLLLIALLLLTTVALQGCAPGYYFSMHLEQAGGKPYMLVEYSNGHAGEREETYFSIYTPTSENWDNWETIVADRLGPAYALYLATHRTPAAPENATAGAEKAAPPARERLGVLHERRATLFDVSQKPATVDFEILPFNWRAETAVTQNGVTYAFGVTDNVYEPPGYEGKLKVAKFDGLKWEELKIDGPVVKGNKYGFWLKSVETSAGIRLFWRDYDLDTVIRPDWEGKRVVTTGPLRMATFTGDAFGPSTVQIPNLPRGNASPFVDGQTLKLLIQTRHKTEDAISHNGPMEIWTLPAAEEGKPAVTAEKTETIEASRAKGGLLAYLFAQHFSIDNQQYIVRSNLQVIEIWKKADGEWKKVAYKPRGLPVYDLESVLLSGLAVSLGMIIFGAGLAYHRRKQALALITKVRTVDLYASVGLRSGAYAVDLAFIFGCTVVLGKVLGWSFVSPIQMLNFFQEPYWPFFVVYMIYLAGSEKAFGASPGKFIMGLSVVMEGGKPLTLWAALVRNFVGFFERLPPVFPLVTLWMIILGPRRQRLGDVLSRCFVVQKGALEAYKKQHAQAAAPAAPELDVLPPIDPWEGEGAGKRNKAGERK